MEDNTYNPNRISVKDIINKSRKLASHIWKRRWLIVVITIFMGVIGCLLAVFQKVKYTAVCTFVLEDNSNSGLLAQYAGLASLAGIDAEGSGGIFKGDNIIQLYQSRLMIQATLLSDWGRLGKPVKLIDRYIAINHLRNKWLAKPQLAHINFNRSADNYNRAEDSIIIDLVEKINDKYLKISRPDKKLNIIRVEFTSTDEQFAKDFADQIVKNVNEFYIKTRTKKTATDFMILQHQTDSVKRTLNLSIQRTAFAIDATPNSNPNMVSLRVPSQQKQIDVQANMAIYAEMKKNLETARVSLRKETPLIQLIDEPMLPLSNNRVGVAKGAIVGALAGFFLSIAAIVARRLCKNIIEYSV